jgi:hypothetical protein
VLVEVPYVVSYRLQLNAMDIANLLTNVLKLQPKDVYFTLASLSSEEVLDNLLRPHAEAATNWLVSLMMKKYQMASRLHQVALQEGCRAPKATLKGGTVPNVVREARSAAAWLRSLSMGHTNSTKELAWISDHARRRYQ